MALPERVSQNRKANEQLLYFTSSSLRGDDGELFFLSDASGHPNIIARCLSTGRERPLTQNAGGFLKSYVYFDGVPYSGLGKASISLHARSGSLYYIQGLQIRKIDPSGQDTLLAAYPHGQMTGFTHVSDDGRFLCVPTTDARALDGDQRLSGKPDYNIDERIRQERLCSYLRVYDTESGEEVVCEAVPGGWVTHVQFAPGDPGVILYNHEWASDCGIRRMWLFDGREHRPLRDEGEHRSRNDWVCHEMWERDGTGIIYHGKYQDGPAFIGRVEASGTKCIEIALPDNYQRYGHFTVGRHGELVSDACYEEPGDKKTGGSDWISMVHVNWSAREFQWTPLCRNSSSWDSQDAHPHPILDHAGRSCYFTSDQDGRRAIYRIPCNLPASDLNGLPQGRLN